jgi:She9 / Mdm33 family
MNEGGAKKNLILYFKYTELTQRKDSWSDADITHFTHLYRRDLSLEATETQTKAAYKSAADASEAAQAAYLSAMRERYVEEQMFSDRIKSASTWWTWGLISMHFMIFVAVQFIVEPRKRRDLKNEMAGIIERVGEADRAAMAVLLSEHLKAVDSNKNDGMLVMPIETVTAKHSFWSAAGISSWITTLLADLNFWRGICFGSIMTIAMAIRAT